MLNIKIPARGSVNRGWDQQILEAIFSVSPTIKIQTT